MRMNSAGAAARLFAVAMVISMGNGLFAHAIHGGDERAKEEVLHDGQLAENLGDEHAAHTAVDFGPRFGGRDVVKHGAVPAETLDSLGAVDEADLSEVHEIGAKLLESEFLVDGARGDVWMMKKLGGAEQEGQELVVVQAPYAMRPGRLEIVGHLNDAHDGQVAGEDAQNEGSKVRGWYEGELIEAEEPDDKVELVAGAVVDAVAVAERLAEIGGDFGGGGGVGDTEVAMPGGEPLAKGVEEVAEDLVAEARATLVTGGEARDERLGFVQDGQQRVDNRTQVRVLDGGAGRVHDGVGEAEDPGQEKLVGGRGGKGVEVLLGEDASPGHLEGGDGRVRRGRQGGRLGAGGWVGGGRTWSARLELREAVFEVRYGGVGRERMA